MDFFQGLHFTDSSNDIASQKPVMVLLHGFFMDHRLFKHQITFFEQTHRVICCDMRGFGETVWEHKPFSLYDIADDVIALMDHLNIDQFILGGMSVGGYIAQRIAIRYPERISHLILMATQAGTDNPDTVAAYHQLRDNWENTEVRSMIIESLLPVIIGEHEEEQAYWKQVWLNYDANCIFHPMNAMTGRDTISVQTITQPTLVIHGSADMGIPFSAAQSLIEQLPNARLVVIEEACHALNLTHPEQTNKAMAEFLDIAI